MKLTSSYILLLARHPDRLNLLASLLGDSDYLVTITNSEEQAVAQIVQEPPFLIILAGDHHHWSRTLLEQLRSPDNVHRVTLVAVTDFHAPSWMYQEENPGFDGFLVNPISSEVLLSLVQSAHTRQMCCSVG